jgi:heme exporter protein A
MQACHLAARDIACRRGDRLLFKGLSFALQGRGAAPCRAERYRQVQPDPHSRRPAPPFAGTVEREGALALSDERLALDGHQPLGAALAFWRRIDGSGDEGADFGLEDLLDVPVRYLSTGQRKRAALARVAASQAAIWLLDEPLNGLDTQWAAVAQERIAAHLAGGGAVVIASHQPLALAGVRQLALRDYVA